MKTLLASLLAALFALAAVSAYATTPAGEPQTPLSADDDKDKDKDKDTDKEKDKDAPK
jgi:hypothetical protein